MYLGELEDVLLSVDDLQTAVLADAPDVARVQEALLKTNRD